jgi:Protein of unknown function (DUF1236)
MRTRILITTTAALLAGTVFAAAQSVQGGGEREKTGASQGQMQRPAGKEAAGKEQAAPNRNAQANPPQGQQRGREQPTTSGQGSREPDAKPLDNKSEGGKSQTERQPDNKQQGQAQRPTRTEGQAPREDGQNQNQRQPQQGQNQREPERNTQGAREGERGGTNVSVNLTSEQRTKIRDTVFKEKDAPRVGKVDFSLKEGTVIPRTVKIVEIPQVIIDIHPEWRRYRYFIVNEELVIVEPDTLRIVAIIEV